MNELLFLIKAVLSICFIVFVIWFYFMPYRIANKRNHPHKNAIFALNLCLGWTGWFWVGALVWALIGGKK